MTKKTISDNCTETVTPEGVKTDAEAAKILGERKCAHARWSYGKSWLDYRGHEFDIITRFKKDGSVKEKIVCDRLAFGNLEDLFAAIDKRLKDSEAVSHAVAREWDAYLLAGAPESS